MKLVNINATKRLKSSDFSLTRSLKERKSELLICSFVEKHLLGPGWDIQVWGECRGKESQQEGTVCVNALRTKFKVVANVKKKPMWPGQNESGVQDEAGKRG